MMAVTPPPELWPDPGPLPYHRFIRSLLRRERLEELNPAWLEQRQEFMRRLGRETEELDRYLQSQAEYDALIQSYWEEGEHLQRLLPIYLHHLKLSYRRTVQDRKSARYYERVDYCAVPDWYFDESAYYFHVSTDPLPWGVSIQMFREPEVAETLAVNVSSEVFIEVNRRGHERPGLWVVIMHKVGRGLIPQMVHYSDMLKKMPKTAPLLSYPVGVGLNGKYYYGDMDEQITVLVVGSRGAGKSNTVNCILNTWLNRAPPHRLRLFLTDLKGGLEFFDYQGIPHLGGDVDIKMSPKKGEPAEACRLGQEIMTDPQEVIPCLKYIEIEMNRRFEVMKGKAKKITAYNKKTGDALSYWIVVIDELATLMDSEVSNEAERLLSEVARKGRAVGIYLVLATQIPDKSVLTRQIAGNMDCRLVGRLADGPSSALSLGDGTWDATYLPKDVPGRMIWRWADKVIVQAPLITDGAVKATVRALRTGELTDTTTAAERDTAMEIFEYALEHLGGECPIKDLYKHFKNRHSFHVINNILRQWEVCQVENGVHPKIDIGEDVYVLVPGVRGDDKNGRKPRQLITVTEFDKNKPKWQEFIKTTTLHIARNGKSLNLVNYKNFKTGATAPTGQPDNVIQPEEL